MGTAEGKSHLEVLGVDEKNNIKMNLQEMVWGPWTGKMWLRIERGCLLV